MLAVECEKASQYQQELIEEHEAPDLVLWQNVPPQEDEYGGSGRAVTFR